MRLEHIVFATLGLGLLINLTYAQDPVGIEKIQVIRDAHTITLSYGNDTILSYYHALHATPPGVDPAFRRSGFIHPLVSPAGHVLTQIQPPDHYHHYGIWSPWTKTHVEGKGVDFWNLAQKQGTVRFAQLLSQSSNPSASGIKVRQEHVQFLPEGKERVVLNEVLDVQAAVETIDDKQAWVIDLVSKFTNILKTPVVLDQYRYGGGLGFRATEQWKKDNCSVITSEGKTRGEADGTRARWCNVMGQTGDPNHTSGVLFLSHPKNREHPEPMRVWPEGIHGGALFFEFCPIRLTSWTLEPNKEYILQYRMIVYDGTLQPETMETLWKNWTSFPVTAQPAD